MNKCKILRILASLLAIAMLAAIAPISASSANESAAPVLSNGADISAIAPASTLPDEDDIYTVVPAPELSDAAGINPIYINYLPDLENPDDAFISSAPHMGEPAFLPYALTIVKMDRSRNIDSIVEKAKALPHSAFNTSKITAYAAVPSFSPPYAAGSLAASDIADALNALKMVRYIAGLPYENVAFTSELNDLSQHGAVLLAASNQFSHVPNKPPDMPQNFFDKAFRGCNEANISAGRSNISDVITSFVADPGSNNIELAGHRRWILKPGGQDYGIGYAQKSGSSYGGYRINMHVFSGLNLYDCESDSYIAWPSSGDFPIQYFINSTNINTAPPYPWSVNLGASYQAPDRENVVLTLTRARDGMTWTFDDSTPQLNGAYAPDNSMHLAVDDKGYGIGKAIIFRPDVASLGAIRDGDVFNVTLSGIYTSSGVPTTLQYSINFFDLAKEMDRSRINITVRHGEAPVQGAAVVIDGQSLVTDENGMATLRVNNNKSYVYSVTKSGYAKETGSISVGVNPVSVEIPVVLAPEITIVTINNDNILINYICPRQTNTLIVVAVYDGGRLIATRMAPVSNTGQTIFNNMSMLMNADAVKTFMWDGMDGMVPLCPPNYAILSANRISSSIQPLK